jgi:hypothetical protein
MSKVTVKCDDCGLVLNAENAFFDSSEGLDLCEFHHIERRLTKALRERDEKQKWLEDTHLRDIKTMNEKISELRTRYAELSPEKEKV